jgi:hypothetical protein
VILFIENERDLEVLAALLGPFGRPMPKADTVQPFVDRKALHDFFGTATPPKYDDDLDAFRRPGDPPIGGDMPQRDPGDENDWQDVAEWTPSKATADYLDTVRQQAQAQSDHEPPCWRENWRNDQRAAKVHVPEMVRELEGDDEVGKLLRSVRALNEASIDYYARRARE